MVVTVALENAETVNENEYSIPPKEQKQSGQMF